MARFGAVLASVLAIAVPPFLSPYLVHTLVLILFFAFLGTASLAFLALADHAFPRLLRRDWRGALLAEANLWSAFAGTAIAGLALMAGGIVHGSMRAEGATPDAIAGTIFWFRLVEGAGIGLVALAAAIAALSIFLMYTGARRADYAVVGEAAPAAGQ